MRPTVSVYIATSLDGFIAREDGSLDWLMPFQIADEDYGYNAFFASVDALVVGRATYETVLGFEGWPYAGKRVVVMTHRPLTPRHGERAYGGDPAALLDALGAEGFGHVYVDGGAVIRQFLEAGLVDQLTLSIVPVLLGRGKPLFGGTPEMRWQHVESRAYATGLTQLKYRR